jgi:hypothetical protein
MTDITLNPTTPVTNGDIVSSANPFPVKIVSGGGTGITVDTTTITGGTTTRLLYDNGGTVGETAQLTWASVSATLTNTGPVTVGNGSSRNLTLGASGGNYTGITARLDDNSITNGATFQNYGITAASQGVALLATFGVSSASTNFAGIFEFLSSDTWAGAASQSAIMRVRLTQAGSALNTALTLSTTLLTLPSSLTLGLGGALTYGGITFASTVTGTGSLVGATNPTVSSLVITGTMTYGGVTYASTVTGTGSNVLATNPTLSSLIATGTLTYGGVTLASTVTGTGSMVLSANASHTGNVTFVSASATGIFTTQNGVAASATGANFALQYSSTASFGVIWGALGSVAPTIAATQGCLYINTSGSSTATRMYIKASAAGTWTNFTTAA